MLARQVPIYRNYSLPLCFKFQNYEYKNYQKMRRYLTFGDA